MKPVWAMCLSPELGRRGRSLGGELLVGGAVEPARVLRPQHRPVLVADDAQDVRVARGAVAQKRLGERDGDRPDLTARSLEARHVEGFRETLDKSPGLGGSTERHRCS